MRSRFLGGLLTLFSLTSLAHAGGDVLYTVSPFDNSLRELDPATGKTLATRTLTLTSGTVIGANGLARHPSTGELWVVLQVSGAGRQLGKVNPTTGAVTAVGALSDKIAGIAFDIAGTLYGVTGDGANTPETLYTLSQTNGAMTLFMALGNGNDGETLAMIPGSLSLLHASGIGTQNSTEILEIIDLTGKKVTSVTLSGDDYEEALAMTQVAGGQYLLSDVNDDLYLVSTAGVVTYVGPLDHSVKGMAFVPATTTAFSRIYGAGCPGSGNAIPTLFGSCPAAGTTATLSLLNGLGGAPCYLALGLGNASAPIGPGCSLHILPTTTVLLAFTLGGTGPRAGTLSVPLAIPTSTKLDVYWQVGVVDNGNLALSNAVQMHIQ
ncbi:MAG: hypothetical protein KDC87_07360 [Planctomycetes bacterium]|nr:hypothetical protein [Planctomycetota bacterium]MCB9870920.1 hypothetical protein [Planctomycetota bacterium]MCB9889728.1 hypothetical protein [Planctomycetota bacterium]